MESISLQLTALFLVTIILVMFVKKTKMVFDTDRVFFCLLISVLVSILLDISVSNFVELGTAGNSGLFSKLYLWSLLGLTYIVSLYTVKIVERKVQFNDSWLYFVMAIPALVIGLIGLLTNAKIVPIGLGFFSGWYVNMIVVCLFVYCFVCLFFISRYREKITQGYYASGIVFYLLLCISLSIQLVLKEYAILSIGVAISILYMYMEMENPDDYLDHASGALNDYAFSEWGRDALRRREGVRLIIISLPDVGYIKNRLGNKVFEQYIRTVFLSMKELRVGKIFRLDSGEFVLASKSSETEEYIHKKLVMVFQELHTEFTSMSSDVIRYGSVQSFGDYENMQSFADDLWFFLQYLREQSTEELLVLNDEIVRQRTNEDYIVASLQDAIVNKRVMVYYQPIYSVKEQRFTTTEALIRIKDLEGNFMNPEIFIPIAERRGLILTLGDIVFHNVCRFVQEQKLMEKGFHYVEVNLSTVQCMQDNLSAQLVSIMNQYEIEPGFINLEITETAAVQSDKVLLENMEKMRELGVTFSLDDYGSGYSNLDYVINMPFRLVKIDKTLVWDSVKKKKSKILLETSISMFSKMNLQIVAEGVETAEQATYLEDLGVDYLQGYYFSKPVCEADFLAVLRKNGIV